MEARSSSVSLRRRRPRGPRPPALLVDGFHIVPDLQRSHGSYLVDERDGKTLPRPLLQLRLPGRSGWNHPGLADPEFRERLLLAALHKPANSDLYTRFFAEFIDTFAHVARPGRPHRPHVRRRGWRPRGRERPQDRLRLEGPEEPGRRAQGGESGSQVIHFRQAFHGRSGYTLSLTNTSTPARRHSSPSSTGRGSPTPASSSRSTRTFDEVERAGSHAVAEIEAAVSPLRRRHRLPDHRADPGRGRRQPLPARVPARAARARRPPRLPPHLRRGADRPRDHRHHVGVAGARRRAGHLRLRQEGPGLRHSPPTRRIDDVADNVFQVSSRINSTWGGNLTDMVRATRVLEIMAAGEPGRTTRASRVRSSSTGLHDAPARVPPPPVAGARTRPHDRVRPPRRGGPRQRDRRLPAAGAARCCRAARARSASGRSSTSPARTRPRRSTASPARCARWRRDRVRAPGSGHRERQSRGVDSSVGAGLAPSRLADAARRRTDRPTE